MALETLKDVNEIGGFELVHFSSEVPRDQYHALTQGKYVFVRHDTNTLTFRIQNGPIKENGINGCQVDTVIEAAKVILESLNKQFPCRENSCAVTHLDEALNWLERRRRNREKRGVEGYSKA